MKLEILIIAAFIFLGISLTSFGSITKTDNQLANAPSTNPTNSISNTPTPGSLPTVSPTATSMITPTITPTSTPIPPSPTSVACATTSTNTYQTVGITPLTINPPPESHPDINMAVRGYKLTTKALLGLVSIGGPGDTKAPQLATLLARGVPTFTHAYQIYSWNWTTNQRGDLDTEWQATVLGFGTNVGENLHVPNSGYLINAPLNLQTLVLYATQTSITLKYTMEDTAATGYTLHVDGFCTDPNLLKAYNAAQNSGRNTLPALAGNQVFGTASSPEVRVAIVDSGSYMDPRSGKDWWLGYQGY